MQPNGKMVEGVWLPPQEQHLVEWMTVGKRAHRRRGRITYQWWKQEAAHRIASERGFLDGKAMIDVGAHCALWSMWWAEWVDYIYAFEPIHAYRQLFRENMALEEHDNYELHPFAVADKQGKVAIRVDPTNTGGTRAYAKGEAHDVQVERVDMVTLDGRTWNREIGVLKIDCEGYEEKVCRGAEYTIKTHKPLIVVEQKFENKHFGFKRKGAVSLLESWGYHTVKEISGDHIMVPL